MKIHRYLFCLAGILAFCFGMSQALASEDLEAQADDSVLSGSSEETPAVPAENVVKPENKGYRIYAEPHDIHAMIETTEGTVCCDLFIVEHPLTVLNFKGLSSGRPAWTDKNGVSHTEPFYNGLSFDIREKGKFASAGERPEGTNFVIPDERCSEHSPKAGSLVMVQPHPNKASTRFAILQRDIPEFSGMYIVFGQCQTTDVISKLTEKEAIIQKITVTDGSRCSL